MREVAAMVKLYMKLIQAGIKALEDVPENLRQAVKALLEGEE